MFHELEGELWRLSEKLLLSPPQEELYRTVHQLKEATLSMSCSLATEQAGVGSWLNHYVQKLLSMPKCSFWYRLNVFVLLIFTILAGNGPTNYDFIWWSWCSNNAWKVPQHLKGTENENFWGQKRRLWYSWYSINFIGTYFPNSFLGLHYLYERVHSSMED